VLYGVTRYEKLLDAFMDAFVREARRERLRKEKLETRVCAYLALLRLDELGFGAFAAMLIRAPERCEVRGAVFGVFIRRGARCVECGVVDKWRLTYDDAYVANALGSLDERKGDALVLLDAFDAKSKVSKRRQVRTDMYSDVSDDDDDDDDVDDDDDGSRVAGRKRNARKTSRFRVRSTSGRADRAPRLLRRFKETAVQGEPRADKHAQSWAHRGEIAVRRAELKNREAVLKKYADPRSGVYAARGGAPLQRRQSSC